MALHGIEISLEPFLRAEITFRAGYAVYPLSVVDFDEMIRNSLESGTVIGGDSLEILVILRIEEHDGFSCLFAEFVDIFTDIIVHE